MKIYTQAGELPVSWFTFPDGQPHVKLEGRDEFRHATIETRIANPEELFEVQLVNDVLRNNGYTVSLDVRYLMGARMDRAIDTLQPDTLQAVARIINLCGFSQVRILDPHSVVALERIANSSGMLPRLTFRKVLTSLAPVQIAVPDKGARQKVMAITGVSPFPRVFCTKNRDSQTGKITGLALEDPKQMVQERVMIVDDICDGGATFIALAKVLRAAGAQKVYLFVTHGIFSKGLPLEGVDGVFCTDSYAHATDGATTFPISMRGMDNKEEPPWQDRYTKRQV